jgi:hypothetical protein
MLDPRDDFHEVATDLAKELDEDAAPLVTADAVFLELCAYFARGPLRSEAVRWVEVIRASPGWEVLPLDRPTLARAEDRYRRHADKTWSLTDCFLMEVLDARGTNEVATTDHHFEQAGYRALLRE